MTLIICAGPEFPSYDSSVDTIGEVFGFIYVSRFCAVAKLQRHKIGRLWKAKRAHLFASGFAGLGYIASTRRIGERSRYGISGDILSPQKLKRQPRLPFH